MGRPTSDVASRPVLAGTSALFIIGLLSNCAARRPVRNDYGIPHCSATAADDLLSANALQCWFAAPYGRWRTLSHESHFAVLVVEVEAADLRDADDIARRFVTGQRSAFSEIVIYVQREPTTDSPTIRRIRWTPDAGFERLDFSPPRPSYPAVIPCGQHADSAPKSVADRIRAVDCKRGGELTSSWFRQPPAPRLRSR